MEAERESKMNQNKRGAKAQERGAKWGIKKYFKK
jgi:hypothetical protein